MFGLPSFSMPIYQADLDLDRSASAAPIDIEPSPEPSLDILSSESLPADLCEGPVPDSPRRPEDESATSNRSELIQRLKRGQSPTWIPNRHVRYTSHPGPYVLSSR